MSLYDTLYNLGMNTSIFNRADVIKNEILRLQTVLKDEIVDCVNLLEEEGLTKKERKVLLPAIMDHYSLCNIDLTVHDFSIYYSTN
jgi:hypothetical protein